MNLRKPVIVATVLAVLGAALFIVNSIPTAAERDLREAQEEAHAAGFKFTLAEFELTPAEAKDADIITGATASLPSRAPNRPQDGRHQPLTPYFADTDDPEALAAALRTHARGLDTVRRVLSEGRLIRLKVNPSIPLRLDSLAGAFAARAILAAREDRPQDAWADLLALSLLAVRLEPGASMPLHVARSEVVKIAVAATHDILQTRDWSNTQLATLEHLWREPDLFRGVTDIPMLQCAEAIDAQRRGEDRASELIRTFSGIPEARNRVASWPPGGMSEFRDWAWSPFSRSHALRVEFPAIEAAMIRGGVGCWGRLRKVVPSTDWRSMKSAPLMESVMELTFFPYPDRPSEDWWTPLGKIAEAEARRRVLLAALTVQLAKRRLGRLPATLAEAGPVLPDFMDGQPLRYRAEPDGTYSIHSIGLDLMDDGGDFKTDIVWPRCVPAATTPKSNASP